MFHRICSDDYTKAVQGLADAMEYNAAVMNLIDADRDAEKRRIFELGIQVWSDRDAAVWRYCQPRNIDPTTIAETAWAVVERRANERVMVFAMRRNERAKAQQLSA